MGRIRTMASKLVPLLDRVLVQRAQAQARTAGGIMLPESVQAKINEATVIAVGPGGRAKDGATIPMAVKVGDKVMLPEYGGTALKLNDEEYHVFRDEDIIGILQ